MNGEDQAQGGVPPMDTPSDDAGGGGQPSGPAPEPTSEPGGEGPTSEPPMGGPEPASEVPPPPVPAPGMEPGAGPVGEENPQS